MLHRIRLICFLYCLADNIAPDIAPVDKIIFVIAVSARYHGLPNKTGNPYAVRLTVHFNDRGGGVTSKNMVDTILQAPVSRCLQFRFPVVDKFKCNFRMCRGKALHQVTDIARLRHGRF